MDWVVFNIQQSLSSESPSVIVYTRGLTGRSKPKGQREKIKTSKNTPRSPRYKGFQWKIDRVLPNMLCKGGPIEKDKNKIIGTIVLYCLRDYVSKGILSGYTMCQEWKREDLTLWMVCHPGINTYTTYIFVKFSLMNETRIEEITCYMNSTNQVLVYT